MAGAKTQTHDHRFPGESQEYRKARNELLVKEQELRDRIEEVAALRRKLPPGGVLLEDYEFEEIDYADGSTTTMLLSELFGDKDHLIIYSYMYGPDWKNPCPSCTSVIDGLSVSSRHVREQVELVVVGKASPKQLHAIAVERTWRDLRLLSSLENDYTRDYLSQPGESTESLMPLMNVFERDGDEIRHFWASETLWTPVPGGHPRHVDLVWPMWGLLDMTRAGRHPAMSPKLRYGPVV